MKRTGGTSTSTNKDASVAIMYPSNVKTEGRFVQLEVGCSDWNKASPPFMMGGLKWHLRVSRSFPKICVELLTRPLHSIKKHRHTVCPVVSFSMKLLSHPPNQTILAYHPVITDMPLKMDPGFAWTVDCFVTVSFIIEVKFLDLKVANQSGCDPVSIWPSVALKLRDTCSEFAGVLLEDTPTDITISTSDGSIRAHSSVLAARSPVFQGMFAHNLRERQLSTIDISDMSFDECRALINYMYGNLQEKEFMPHRIALFGAAEKYDMSELKAACLESLMQDLDAENLIDRLQMAHLYQLPELKRTCIRLLLDFGKFYEVQDDFVELIKSDSDLGSEIVREILGRSTGFDS